MTSPTNYSISVPSGTTNIYGGVVNSGDLGVLSIGDSNMVGTNTGANSTLDALSNDIYQLSSVGGTSGQIIQVDTSTWPYLEQATSRNQPNNGVGPDLPFADRFATERANGKRVVCLPCGDFGSGFSTGNWGAGQNDFVFMQNIVNEFFALDSNNTIGAIICNLGVNDSGDFSPDTLWRDTQDAFVDTLRAPATFVGTVQQLSSLSQTPIVWAGFAPSWTSSNSSSLDLQNYIVDLPNRKTKTGYADAAGLGSVSGDNIHFTAASNRILGNDRAWTGYLQAEANT